MTHEQSELAGCPEGVMSTLKVILNPGDLAAAVAIYRRGTGLPLVEGMKNDPNGTYDAMRTAIGTSPVDPEYSDYVLPSREEMQPTLVQVDYLPNKSRWDVVLEREPQPWRLGTFVLGL